MTESAVHRSFHYAVLLSARAGAWLEALYSQRPTASARRARVRTSIRQSHPRRKTAPDPHPVGVVKSREVARYDERRFVHLFGGRRCVFVDQHAPQLPESLQSASQFGRDHTGAPQRIEIASCVGLVTPPTKLGELQPKGSELGDVVVELINTRSTAFTRLSSTGSSDE